jgi:hypothetical protein
MYWKAKQQIQYIEEVTDIKLSLIRKHKKFSSIK